jgi:hypothetical protein
MRSVDQAENEATARRGWTVITCVRPTCMRGPYLATADKDQHSSSTFAELSDAGQSSQTAPRRYEPRKNRVRIRIRVDVRG